MVDVQQNLPEWHRNAVDCYETNADGICRRTGRAASKKPSLVNIKNASVALTKKLE